MSMKNGKYFGILAIIVLLVIAAFNLGKKQESDMTDQQESTEYLDNSTKAEEVYYLPVVETTDIHGYIVDISSGKEESYQYRLGFIANEIDKLRSEGDILLVDTGDCYQGNVLSNKLQGQPIMAYTDVMNYDGIGLGNHEFDWGLGTVIDHDATVGSYNLSDTINGDSDVPILCWNLYDSKTGDKVDFTKDYVIVEKTATSSDDKEKKLKIAIFGYINDYSNSISASCFDGYEIHENEIAQVEAKAKELEEAGQADITVITCHVSPDNMDTLVGANSVIDLVVCGHNHKIGVGDLSNGVPYILGGCYGQSYATATFTITEDGKVTVENQQIINVTDNEEQLYDNEKNSRNFDKEVMEISHTALDVVNEKYPDVLEKLGYITTDISMDPLDGSIGEDVATNWASSVKANSVGAQVGITNSTGVRCEIKLHDGETTHEILGADIYTMFPFGNKILVYSLTYEQLLDLCNNTKLNSYSYIGISGITAYFGNGDGSELTTLYLGDEKIYDNGWIADKNSTVTVAVDNYLAGFDRMCFVKLKPINDDNAIDNVTILDYLRKTYGADKEIVIDTSVHLHNRGEK